MKFNNFLKEIEEKKLDTTVTSKGLVIIQQTLRNKMRKEGELALYEDLMELYPDFDILQTADGIVFVSRNEDFDFSFELKCSIKAVDYDPYTEADEYAEQESLKEQKKQKNKEIKEAKIRRDAELRAIALREKNKNNGK